MEGEEPASTTVNGEVPTTTPKEMDVDWANLGPHSAAEPILSWIIFTTANPIFKQ
jgi:hypothetical protein